MCGERACLLHVANEGRALACSSSGTQCRRPACPTALWGCPTATSGCILPVLNVCRSAYACGLHVLAGVHACESMYCLDTSRTPSESAVGVGAGLCTHQRPLWLAVGKVLAMPEWLSAVPAQSYCLSVSSSTLGVMVTAHAGKLLHNNLGATKFCTCLNTVQLLRTLPA